ncbi:MAG: MFS transporter [Anaerolineae bacterium]|nr:MFS transporter [Anaerolineae bacterium]
MSAHRNIRVLAWFNFLLDFTPYAPVAILYFKDVAGTYALAASVFSLVFLSSSLFEVPTGIFSDRIGRKRTVVCGALASLGAGVSYAIGGTYTMLCVGAILEGLARSFFSGNNDALLHDTLTEIGQPQAYQEFLGKTSSAYQMALAISAVIGSILAAISFGLVMWVSVIPRVLLVGLSTRFVEPKRVNLTPLPPLQTGEGATADGLEVPLHVGEGFRVRSDTAEEDSTNIYAHLRESLRLIWRNPRLRLLSAASIIGFAVGEAAYQFRAAFTEKVWPIWAIGFARLISNGSAALSFYFAGRLIKRFGELRLLVVGITLSECTNMLAMLLAHPISPAMMASTSMFFGVNTVGVNGLMQREFTHEQRATMGSINSFGGSLGFAVFSFLLGGAADQFGVIPALLVAQAIGMSTVLLFWRAFRHPAGG